VLSVSTGLREGIMRRTVLGTLAAVVLSVVSARGDVISLPLSLIPRWKALRESSEYRYPLISRALVILRQASTFHQD